MSKTAINNPICLWRRIVQVPRLASSCSATRLAPQLSPLSSRQPAGITSSAMRPFSQHRGFSTSKDEKAPSESSEDPPPSDAWVSILENTVSSPWLFNRPSTPERTLERAFTLILQILLALNVPREPEAARAFFFAFENAPVSSTSDMGRGRRAIGILTRIVVDDISSIPITSSLRQQHPKVFALHDALVPLREVFLRDPSDNIEDWKGFWSRAEGPLFELDTELDNAGFGLDLEKLMVAQKEEEAANQMNPSGSTEEVTETEDSSKAPKK